MTVSDSGIGFTEDKLAELHAMADSEYPPAAEADDTKLKLNDIYILIKSMGGFVKAESKYGEGSIFTITLPQKIKQKEKLAQIEDPTSINVLIYERREQCAQSIERTMKNLGVDYALVSSASDFYEHLTSRAYSFVFVATVLYDRVRQKYANLESKARIILVEDFGDDVPNHGLSLLSTPIYCVPIANILNGNTGFVSYGDHRNTIKPFTASNARVLVVDDIYTNLQVTAGWLLPYAMKVDLCLNGEEAIQKVKRTKYDFILMDHMMPGMDGMETTVRIRAMGEDDPYYKELPIILFTANAAAGMRDMMLESGINDYLAKPVDTVKLNILLEKWLPASKLFFPGPETITPEPPPARETPALHIEGLNTTLGIAMTGGNYERYLETLAVFYDDGMERIKEINNCMDTGDIGLYIIHIHALKSVLASVGAKELSGMAKALEEAGKNGELDYIRAHNPMFLLNFEALLNNIKPALPETGGMESNTAESLELLAQLKDALDTLDFVAIQSISEQLHSYAATAPVLKAILISDYEDAINKIEMMLS
jgi:CheY-like chemotaxis protein